MFHRTKSFFSCVSLSGVLALGACGGGGGDEPGPAQTARFSEASTDELTAVVMVANLAEFASIIVPLVAFIEGTFSENGCPEVTETSIVGNCTTADGTRYEGSAEIEPNAAGLFSSVTYRGLRHTDSEGSSFYLDGIVVFTEESDEELRYDLAMTVEIQDGFDAEVGRMDVGASAICLMQDEASARCTLQAGSAEIEGFGGFTIEGTHALGSDLGGNLNSAEVVAQGADRMHIDYDVATECMTYTIEDGEPQQSCPEE